MNTNNMARAIPAGDCISCDCVRADPDWEEEVCPKSKKDCGHHCNHSHTHDGCCYCLKEWGPEEA